MSERNYEEIWEYTMKILRDEYKTQNKEADFQLWFNMNYVEDTIDTITVSVASTFLYQSMLKKGNFDIVLKKPKTKEELIKCHGMGEKRYAKYGKLLLDIILKYV